MLAEQKERDRTQKIPLVVMVGQGRRLPALYEYTNKTDSPAYICLVISHQKYSSGVEFSLARNIPAIYANFAEWKRLVNPEREEYAKLLGYLAAQKAYAGKGGLVIMTGWDLIMPEVFLDFFKSDVLPNRVINVHPGLLPDDPFAQEIILSNGYRAPVIRGKHSEATFEEVLKLGLEWFGATVHFAGLETDNGKVILRGEVPVDKNDTVESLGTRVKKKEEEILPQAIEMLAKVLEPPHTDFAVLRKF